MVKDINKTRIINPCFYVLAFIKFDDEYFLNPKQNIINANDIITIVNKNTINNKIGLKLFIIFTGMKTIIPTGITLNKIIFMTLPYIVSGYRDVVTNVLKYVSNNTSDLPNQKLSDPIMIAHDTIIKPPVIPNNTNSKKLFGVIP